MGANIGNENNLLFKNKKLDFAKIISLVIFLSIFFGGFVVFTYLKDIGQTAIFPDLLQMAYSLSAITIVFVSLSVVLLFCMFVPYMCNNLFKREINYLGRLGYNNISFLNSIWFNVYVFNAIIAFLYIMSVVFDGKKVLLVCFLLLFLFCEYYAYVYRKIHVKIKFFNSVFRKSSWDSIAKCVTNIIFLFVAFLIFYYKPIFVFILLNIIIILKYISPKEGVGNFIGAIFIPISFMISNLFFVLLALDIARSEKYSEEYSSIIFVLMIFLYLAIYVANAYFVCFLHRKGDMIEIKHFSILCVIFFSIACFLIHFDRGKQLPRYILYPLHFIEHPRDANWYTIDTRFWAPNNLSIEEIKKYSQELTHYFGYAEAQTTQCQHIIEQEVQKKACEETEKALKSTERYNRFYGYLAWNLGETKIFCPYGFENKENKMRCLALNSEYIIPYY